jgi:hypothetical protein
VPGCVPELVPVVPGCVPELVPVVPGCVPELPPEVIRTPPTTAPPPIELLLGPADLLTVRGPGRQPIVLIEVPRRGPIMGAMAMTPRGPGPWVLLARPPDPDDDLVVPHPAFSSIAARQPGLGRRLPD